MKKNILCYSILALLSVWQVCAGDSSVNDWGALTNNLQMSIRLDEDMAQCKSGQPFSLLIRYKNVSTNESFTIYEVNGTVDDSSYSFSVISPSGKDMSPDIAKVARPWSGAIRNLPPGQMLEIKFNLSKFCNLDEVGTYKIVAKKGGIWSPADSKTFEIVSNPLYLKVVSK